MKRVAFLAFMGFALIALSGVLLKVANIHETSLAHRAHLGDVLLAGGGPIDGPEPPPEIKLRKRQDQPWA